MNRKGFTLVEIMIVVAIIALLAAIAIPNLLRARHNANEAAAQVTLKTISTACESFRAAQTVAGYPDGLDDLTDATPAYIDLTVDTVTTENPKQGYNYVYTQINANQFVCSARPDVINVTGTRAFAINESGVLRAGADGAVATEAAYTAFTVVQ